MNKQELIRHGIADIRLRRVLPHVREATFLAIISENPGISLKGLIATVYGLDEDSTDFKTCPRQPGNVVSSLVERELIRQEASRDRRIKFLRLTEKGAEELNRGLEIIKELNA